MMSTVIHQNDYFSLDNFVEPHFSHPLSWCKESTEWGHSTLRMFAGVAIENYHKLGDLNKKTSSPHSAGGWKPQIKGWAGPPSLRVCHPSYLVLASAGGLQSLACLAWQLCHFNPCLCHHMAAFMVSSLCVCAFCVQKGSLDTAVILD